MRNRSLKFAPEQPQRVRATVADRSGMLVPVLLGRLALAPEFVVDPGRKYVLSGKAKDR